MIRHLVLGGAALAFTTTLGAQVATQGSKTTVRVGSTVQAAAPTESRMVRPNLTPLAGPTELKASGTTQAIALTWSAAAGATGYRVWRIPVGGMESLLTPSPTAMTSLLDAAGPFLPYAQYVYRVTAVHPSGESGPVQTTFLPPLPAPAQLAFRLQGARGNCTATVQWSPVAGAAEYVVTVKRRGNYPVIAAATGQPALQYNEYQSAVRVPGTSVSHDVRVDAFPPSGGFVSEWRKNQFAVAAVYRVGGVPSAAAWTTETEGC